MNTLFVRHGTTEWNELGRIQGWAPVGLSESGRAEADRVADALAERHAIDAVVASDLARTVETAEPIAAAAGVELETDPRLRERDFGVFQGLASGDFFERFPAFDLLENGRDAAERAPESGESWLAVRERVLDAAADFRARDETVVAVTHVNPIRLVAGERRDLSVVRSLTELSADNCSVTAVDDRGALVRENDPSYK
ncbi:histidine phosphatase family protein [Halorubrum sp. CBA1229]|uniref:histidine phosphatase family protein n=1 Tax=Halorubrum sp. CBA1229 TaxID=1853699 RepID=UPI000F3CAFCC|nr:histidine phosphatase family protein [Halorubrum sp. CBA1229]QKY16578.1 histidine phosphatase family protein [Halorubrum sp. CBA1229]